MFHCIGCNKDFDFSDKDILLKCVVKIDAYMNGNKFGYCPECKKIYMEKKTDLNESKEGFSGNLYR